MNNKFSRREFLKVGAAAFIASILPKPFFPYRENIFTGVHRHELIIIDKPNTKVRDCTFIYCDLIFEGDGSMIFVDNVFLFGCWLETKPNWKGNVAIWTDQESLIGGPKVLYPHESSTS